jgi:hypothetical protein
MNIYVQLPLIEIPVTIITKKIARNKTDSFFYSGKAIASVKYGNREYILTTAGMYDFTFKVGKKEDHYKLESYSKQFAKLVRKYKLTDAHIKSLTDDGHTIENWGWFGINVYVNDRFQDTPTDAYGTYDEAMEAFKEYVVMDYTNSINLIPQ